MKKGVHCQDLNRSALRRDEETITDEEERERAEEEREIEARLEKQRARHTPKERRDADPIPVVEKKEDLNGNTLVFFDSSSEKKQNTMQVWAKEKDVFEKI